MTTKLINEYKWSTLIIIIPSLPFGPSTRSIHPISSMKTVGLLAYYILT